MLLIGLLLVVVYIRLSSDGQNVAMQMAAAKHYLKDVPEAQIKFLIDDGVSALQLKMDNRPHLVELIDLIREGKVGTLIVYDRDRLARNFYEYLQIVQLLHDKEVKVIFTGSDVRPFDRSFVIEAIGAIFAQQEGLTITRRRSDAQQQFPSRLFGYERHKSETGQVTFTHSEDAKKMLAFFEAIADTSTTEEFLATLPHFKRILHKSDERLVDMLNTPFYAGCWEREGEMLSLEHVDPIVTLALYQKVQKRMDDFKSLTSRIKAPSLEEALIPPNCGLCGKPMKYKRDRLNAQAHYICSGGHRRFSVAATQLITVTEQIVKQKANALNVDAVMLECGAWLRNERAKNLSQMRHVEEKINQCSLLVVNNHGRADAELIVRQLLDKQKTLEADLVQLNLQQQSYDILKSKITLLGTLVARYVTSQLSRRDDMTTLAQMLIHRIDIYPDKIRFLIYFSKFFNEGSEHYDAS